jgi:thiol-disulfide isomerase/thioredoxin
MFRTQITRIVLIVLICGLAGCNSNDPPTKIVVPGPPLSGSINTLGWTNNDGKRSVFSDYRGKVLVLDFYATWCKPCRLSIPHLVGLQKNYEAQGLQVIGLNVGGPDDPAKVPAFAAGFGIQYPLAIPDDDLVMFLMADNDAIPQTFVFDRQGQLVERFVGFGATTGARIDKAVEAALQSPAQ